MLKEDVKAVLEREPFVPFRIYLAGGKTYKVTSREAARYLGYGVLVFIGHKAGTCQSKGYDRFAFDRIDRIEDVGSGDRGRPRRKVS